MFLPYLVVALIGYLIGSLPFGYLVARRHGINIFEHGSKNPGATNVGRVLGKSAGRTVFVLDALKGAVAAWWALLRFTEASVIISADESWLPPRIELAGGTWLLIGLAGLVGALLGHSFSCFTKFRGGKGVATTAGGFLVLATGVVLCAAAVWVVTFYASRYVSLASILAAVALPAAAFAFGEPLVLEGVTVAIGLIVILRHRTNIRRLLDGTENKFVKKTAGPAQS